MLTGIAAGLTAASAFLTVVRIGAKLTEGVVVYRGITGAHDLAQEKVARMGEKVFGEAGAAAGQVVGDIIGANIAVQEGTIKRARANGAFVASGINGAGVAAAGIFLHGASAENVIEIAVGATKIVAGLVAAECLPYVNVGLEAVQLGKDLYALMKPAEVKELEEALQTAKDGVQYTIYTLESETYVKDILETLVKVKLVKESEFEGLNPVNKLEKEQEVLSRFNMEYPNYQFKREELAWGVGTKAGKKVGVNESNEVNLLASLKAHENEMLLNGYQGTYPSKGKIDEIRKNFQELRQRQCVSMVKPVPNNSLDPIETDYREPRNTRWTAKQ